MEEIRLKALAKINLGLDVVRRREDGYHEVRMIMQTVQMYDQITIHQMDKPGIKVRQICFICPPMRTIWSTRRPRC